jgi:hypothetical protein
VMLMTPAASDHVPIARTRERSLEGRGSVIDGASYHPAWTRH